MKAILMLDDGTIFKGEAIGAEGDSLGEIVFNTGMTGYQEVLTDPSYAGQIVAMTYPLIGNYGVSEDDMESARPQVKGFIVRELCDEPNNWRSSQKLDDFLKKHNITGIQGIDTRALTRILREKGTMNGVISTRPDFKPAEWMERIHSYAIIKPVDEVTTRERLHYKGDGLRIALMDYGVKNNILQSLRRRGCDITVFPAGSSAEEVLEADPDGIVLTNGPGDPRDCTCQIDTLKNLIGRRPIFGICLGHQLVALAHDAGVCKLKYGHRGGNHPVKDMEKDRTYVTSQNHGYAVLADGLDPKKAVVSHINMNDNTVEGIRYLDTPTFTVQFHPEASPGPMDTGYLFDEFIDLIRRNSCQKDRT